MTNATRCTLVFHLSSSSIQIVVFKSVVIQRRFIDDDLYRIMGLEISDASLRTTARPRSRTRVLFWHIKNKGILEVVIDF